MKNSKKLIALVLAMVMIFALTASALAATDSTNDTIEVTVSISKRYPSGMTPILSETVTVPSNATAYNAVQVFLDSQAAKTTYPRVSDAVLKVVPVVDENGSTIGQGHALFGMNLKTKEGTNSFGDIVKTETLGSHGTTVTTPTSATATSGTYTGDDWIFELYDGYMPVTVDNYLDHTPLQDGYDISLIYQTSNISW